MQTAEKLTFTFVFKLAVLSVLLFIGVMMKSSKVSQPAGTRNITDYQVPVTVEVPVTVKENDTLQIDEPIYKLVKYRLANNASI
ncbi:hypothetical protein ACFSRY_07430 [Pontibacter locisalis]|uniref:Uncharacterized protein n=1 Tax=Pontibacter locisalis TaxID=1719035 RepID=A0ABW5IL38_9BACT